MPTTLLEQFEGGTGSVTAANTTFGSVSTGTGITFDTTHARDTQAGKFASVTKQTLGAWWPSTSLGGTQTSLYGRFYVYVGTTPPALTRLVQLQSSGNVIVGVGLDTSRHVVIRKVSTGATLATSTTVLSTSAWARIEWFVTAGTSGASLTVRIYNGANLDTTTITETITTTGQAFTATFDSVFHGVAFSATQTYTTWLDDVSVQVGSGASWLGPSTPTPPPPAGSGLTLLYDMNADTWDHSNGHAWANLPSKLSSYDPANGNAGGNWGHTAPENITAGAYPDGTKYVQMEMKKLKASDPHARFGAGDYGCRFHFDVAATSITTGRVQWDEEWSGGALNKTSMMGWYDPPGSWPAAGERDLCEQWNRPLGIQVTNHKLDGTHKQNVNHATNVDTSTRQSIRVTITATSYVWEVLQGGVWIRPFVANQDPSWYQPARGYHVEGAVAYSQQVSQGAKVADPAREPSVRRFSNLKVWSGTVVTDSTAPTPNPPTTPVPVASSSGYGVTVTLFPCTDASTGVDHYEVRRAPDASGSPGTYVVINPAVPSSGGFFDGGVQASASPQIFWYSYRCLDGAGNATGWSTGASVTIPAVTTTVPVMQLQVAPADGSSPATDLVSLDAPAAVIFDTTGSVGADSITVYVQDGTGTTLGVDPAVGMAQYTYLQPGTYTPYVIGTNVAGASAPDVAVVDALFADAGVNATPVPRKVYVTTTLAYAPGALMQNDLYLRLQLHVASDQTTFYAEQGVNYVVEPGSAGPTPTGTGGNNGGADEPFTDTFDNTF